MNLYRRLLAMVKPYWFKLVGAMICMVFVSFLTAGQAFLVKPALDGVFLKKEQIPEWIKTIITQLHLSSLLLKKDMEMFLLLPIAIILLFLFKGVFEYGQAYLMNYVGLRIVADIREKLYNHLQTLSLSFFTDSVGILISRMANDVNLIHVASPRSVSDIFTSSFLASSSATETGDYRLSDLPLAIIHQAIWKGFGIQLQNNSEWVYTIFRMKRRRKSDRKANEEYEKCRFMKRMIVRNRPQAVHSSLLP
jgi:subfamily B ATP-binding cassette protein MsbA